MAQNQDFGNDDEIMKKFPWILEDNIGEFDGIDFLNTNKNISE